MCCCEGNGKINLHSTASFLESFFVALLNFDGFFWSICGHEHFVKWFQLNVAYFLRSVVCFGKSV